MSEVWLDREGVTTWERRDYEWCANCFEKACEDGMAVCNSCASERTNP